MKKVIQWELDKLTAKCNQAFVSIIKCHRIGAGIWVRIRQLRVSIHLSIERAASLYYIRVSSSHLAKAVQNSAFNGSEAFVNEETLLSISRNVTMACHNLMLCIPSAQLHSNELRNVLFPFIRSLRDGFGAKSARSINFICINFNIHSFFSPNHGQY